MQLPCTCGANTVRLLGSSTDQKSISSLVQSTHNVDLNPHFIDPAFSRSVWIPQRREVQEAALLLPPELYRTMIILKQPSHLCQKEKEKENKKDVVHLF